MKTFILIFCLFSVPLFAQDPGYAKQINTVHNWIEAYNEQNYGKMKKSFVNIIKVLPIKKFLRKEFAPHYSKYGKATIDTIIFFSSTRSQVKLHFEKDSLKDGNLSIYFNKRSKIQGIGFYSPNFSYLKFKSGSGAGGIQKDIKILKIDSLVKEKYLNDEFNGAVLVIDGGESIYNRAYGYAHFEKKTLLNDSSVFELASVSKQFTAMAILILAEQGKLELSDSIKYYFSDLPYTGITIEHLLTHTSGLPDYMNLMNKHWNKKKIAGNAEAYQMLVKKSPKRVFAPGNAFQYSNTGYMLLSIIIEKTSGMTYGEFLNKSIFTPLEMKHSCVYNTRRSNKDTILNYAYGYVYDKKKKKFALPDEVKGYDYVHYLDKITGDGMVNSSINDLVKWDRALRERRLVSDTAWIRATTAYTLNNGNKTRYGYGLFIEDEAKHEKIHWHSGGWPGYHTVLLQFANHQKTIAILSNNEYNNFMKLADEIGKLLTE